MTMVCLDFSADEYWVQNHWKSRYPGKCLPFSSACRKMDLYLFKRDVNLSYTFDRYSLIWCTHKYWNCPSNGHETCPMPRHTPFPSIWNARHAWVLNLTLHIIMITHCYAITPITSSHCICYHDPDCTLTLSKTWIFVHILWDTRHI